MKKLILSILFVMLYADPAFATIYQVGNEQELKNVLPKLAAGDEVVIADGNYGNWSVEIAAVGTAQKPVVIRGASTGGVIFSGEVNKPLFVLTGKYTVLSGITFKECVLGKADGKSGVLAELKNSSYCRITQCVFTHNVAKVQFMPLIIVSGNGTSNKIDHCTVTANTDSQDFQVKITGDSNPQFTLIESNVFKDKAKVSWSNNNGGECIQVGQDPVLLGTRESNTTVKNNRFTHCDGEPEVISNKSSRNSYIDNYFGDNDGELVMRGGHDCIISGNTFEGGSGGIRVNGSGHTITNNKITGVKTAIRLMYGMTKGKIETGFYVAPGNCTITGNQITHATIGILVGDQKDADWTGKFDTKRYPSPVIQSVAPYDNKIENNQFKEVKTNTVTQ
ncbi:chondroitinase-B domain-containing protein [Hufsiella ginkgonis]|uniref:Right-handed parallel beta-helix repeat-containing protein n=1 Tax=Hufsiella ginkgonis TaxID=2695274 RepID=A0A7K1XVS8_9SPHI|nr:chondroitinase-B domain-containing protein [Hufsiella ginkgonis]MXV15080.1 hypothetical protein [Hufsiella ginkgonis]